MGLNGYISCQELRAGFPHNFPNFVMGQMLWNRNLEYDELKALYFSSLYGSEWKSVVTYLEKLSDYSSCDYFNSIGDRQNAELSMKYNISSKLAFNFINTLEENVAKNNGIQRDAWRQLGYHREYVVKLANALHLMASGDHLDGQIRWKDFWIILETMNLIFNSILMSIVLLKLLRIMLDSNCSTELEKANSQFILRIGLKSNIDRILNLFDVN